MVPSVVPGGAGDGAQDLYVLGRCLTSACALAELWKELSTGIKQKRKASKRIIPLVYFKHGPRQEEY